MQAATILDGSGTAWRIYSDETVELVADDDPATPTNLCAPSGLGYTLRVLSGG